MKTPPVTHLPVTPITTPTPPTPLILVIAGLLLAIGTQPLHAGWIKTYGKEPRDWGKSVQPTTDGGYIATGFTGSFSAGEDVWLLKTDSEGDTLWTRTYGGDSMDHASCVQQTSDGGYIIVGATKSFPLLGDRDLWLLKTDSEGDTLWTRIYGVDGGPYDEDKGCFVLETPDGGYVVFGQQNELKEIGTNFWLFKIDASGDTLWTRTWDLTGRGRWNWSYCMEQTSDGGYILTGTSNPFPMDLTPVLIKTDSEGDTLWTHFYGTEDMREFGTCVQQTPEGGYIVGGFRFIPGEPDSWLESDMWLFKTDENGDTLWTRSYDWQDLDQINSLDQTSDGGYILVGVAGGKAPNTPRYMWLLKTDASGDTLWTRAFGNGEINENEGYCVHQTSDGGYIITGYMDDDLCLIKTDSLGYAANLDLGPNATKAVEAGSFVDYQLTLFYLGDEDDSFHIYLGDSLLPGWRVELWNAVYTDTIPWYFKLKAPVADTVFIARVYAPEGAQTGDTNLTVLYTKTVNCPAYAEDSVFLYSVVGIEGICEPQTERSFNWQLVSSIGKEIVLKYNNLPQGSHVSFAVFDACGRKVDEIHADESSGIITWPLPVTHQSPGVYFIRLESDTSGSARKVVLMK